MTQNEYKDTYIAPREPKLNLSTLLKTHSKNVFNGYKSRFCIMCPLLKNFVHHLDAFEKYIPVIIQKSDKNWLLQFLAKNNGKGFVLWKKNRLKINTGEFEFQTFNNQDTYSRYLDIIKFSCKPEVKKIYGLMSFLKNKKTIL